MFDAMFAGAQAAAAQALIDTAETGRHYARVLELDRLRSLRGDYGEGAQQRAAEREVPPAWILGPKFPKIEDIPKDS